MLDKGLSLLSLPMEMGETATCEEGLHGGTLSQFDRRLSRVGGQSRVCAVVQEQPDDWKVVAGYRVVERPGERGKTTASNTSVLFLYCCWRCFLQRATRSITT